MKKDITFMAASGVPLQEIGELVMCFQQRRASTNIQPKSFKVPAIKGSRLCAAKKIEQSLVSCGKPSYDTPLVSTPKTSIVSRG